MATDEKYPVLNTDNLTIAIQMQLSPNRKKNFFFLLLFWSPAEILDVLKQKMTS